MREFLLSREQRQAVTVPQLAMRILRVMQRNREMEKKGQQTSYFPYSVLGIKGELRDERETYDHAEPEFDHKYAEAVHYLQHNGYIMQHPKQTHGAEFQYPTEAGFAADTERPSLSFTTADAFIARTEQEAGTLDDVAREYLRESYVAAQAKLWLSSVFMLGAASERLIYILSNHVDTLRADTAATAALAKISTVRQRKEWIVDQLPELKKTRPNHRRAFTDVEDKFDSLYNSYRYQRNGAGHPSDTLTVPPSQQVDAMLFSFEIYAKAVNDILAIS